jgi:hypothetical protein
LSVRSGNGEVGWKAVIKWTRLSCRTFAANAVSLQLHALAYNLGNFMQTLALPKAAEPWSLTSPREKLIKIGAKVVSHGRYVTFQTAEVRLDEGKPPSYSPAWPSVSTFWLSAGRLRSNFVAAGTPGTEDHNEPGIRRMSGKDAAPKTNRSTERRIGSGRRKCRVIAICLPPFWEC